VLKEGFHFDDFTYDSTGDYTWDFTGDPTYAWDSVNQEIDIVLTGDGQTPSQFYDDDNLPNSGYIRIVCHSSYIWSDNFGLFVYVFDDKNVGSGYSFIVTGDGSSGYEGIAKMTDWADDDKAGPYAGTLVTPAPPLACDIDIKIECWWSPTYCRMLINDSVERTLTPSVNINEIDIKNISIFYFDGNFSLQEIEVRAWDGKIGKNGNIYHYNFSEIGPSDGLINYWPMNGNAFDYGGYVNNGTVTGATLDYTAPRNKACYDFTNATSDRIDLSSAFILLSAADWSISFWGYKTTYGSQDGICGNASHAAFGNIYFTAADDLTIISTGTDAVFSSFTPAFSTNVWFNCIIINDAGTTNLYNNGVIVSVVDQPLTGSVILRKIGNNASSINYFNGLMFDFRVYNKVLTSQEINILATMYNTVSPITEFMLSRYTCYTFGEFKEN
jgi:hypothetical protein